MKLIINAGSITNAQRAVKILRSTGYRPQLRRLEKLSEGCGYALEVNASDNEPIVLLERNGINVKGVESIDIS